MGRLYVAEQTGIEGFAKIVALKRILPHLADSPHFRRLFLTEARVAARLEHPHIVGTYELGEVDGTYFIAMEYLPGEDTRALLARCRPASPMPLDIAAVIAQQSATGLHHAHEMRDAVGRPVALVHRDVNPSNIFVTYYGMVKLLDFGVATDPTSAAKTNPGLFKGKYAYCAPEQVSGEPVDRRTDVFCLGIVLWECLTGRRLFDGSTDVATIEAVRWQEIPPPSVLRPEVPADLDAIVARALARDRQGRFATAAEMAEALDAFMVQHRHRLTPWSIAAWLEDLFGPQRAALKLAIARGADIEAALARLRAMDSEQPAREPTGGGSSVLSAVRPRALWSTNIGPAPTTQAPPPPPSVAPATEPPRPPVRPGMIAAVALPAALVAGVGLYLARSGPSAPPPTPAVGAIAVESEPSGAHVFVDGNPTGLVTPAVLRGLRAGRSLELRLDKAGHAPATRRVDVAAGEPRREAFTLAAATGTLRFANLPARARVYIDDRLIDTRGPATLPLDRHALRVEVGGELWAERDITIEPGEQTLRLSRPR